MYWDGHLNAMGLRSCKILDTQVFGAELGSVYVSSAVSAHFQFTALNVAGGTSGLLKITGDAPAFDTTSSIFTSGTFWGVELDQTSGGVLVQSGDISGGGLTASANTAQTTVITGNIVGTIDIANAGGKVHVITGHEAGVVSLR